MRSNPPAHDLSVFSGPCPEGRDAAMSPSSFHWTASGPWDRCGARKLSIRLGQMRMVGAYTQEPHPVVATSTPTTPASTFLPASAACSVAAVQLFLEPDLLVYEHHANVVSRIECSTEGLAEHGRSLADAHEVASSLRLSWLRLPSLLRRDGPSASAKIPKCLRWTVSPQRDINLREGSQAPRCATTTLRQAVPCDRRK